MYSQIKKVLPEISCKLKGYFLRSHVDEIWREDRCSGKVNAHFIRILLKLIAMEVISPEIISIYCDFDQFLDQG